MTRVIDAAPGDHRVSSRRRLPIARPSPRLALLCPILFFATIGCRWAPPRTEPPAQIPHDPWRASDPAVVATNRGVALMERYAYADAARAFEQACKAAPEAVQPRINLAIAVYNRAGKGDLQCAEAILDQVLRERPDDTRALYFEIGRAKG